MMKSGHDKSQSILTLLIVVCSCAFNINAQLLTDSINLNTISEQARMDTVGWPILAGKNGGWGKFPDHYTYRRVEIDGQACLVGNYPHAQVHGSSNAIMLDWDGDPDNGQNAIIPMPGMMLSFAVNVYMQPTTHDEIRGKFDHDGVRAVQWLFGPGIVLNDFEPVKDVNKQTDYSWQNHRGPRMGYHTGMNLITKTFNKFPIVQTFAPLQENEIAQTQLNESAKWYDLCLEIKFNDDISGAQCTAKVKLSDEANWQSVGEPWEFPIDKNASAASNPANWNALILDMPYGQWSVKGYGAPKVNMLDRYRNFVVSMRSGNATDKAIRCELMHYNRQKLAVHLKGPDTMFRDDVVDVPIELVNAGDKSIDGELILSINSQKHTLAKNWTLPVDGQWKKITR